MEQTNYIETDGGRAAAGFKGHTGDCGVRAMAIALGLDYKDCYKELAQAHKECTGEKTARKGIHKSIFNDVIRKYGWVWHSAPKFNGRKARAIDMPKGPVIAQMRNHYAAVIDGTVCDSWNSTNKMVYGFWSAASKDTSPVTNKAVKRNRLPASKDTFPERDRLTQEIEKLRDQLQQAEELAEKYKSGFLKLVDVVNSCRLCSSTGFHLP